MKKRFNLKGKMIGLAALAAGAATVIPAAAAPQVMAAETAVEAPETGSTTVNSTERKTVTRVVRYYYKNDDGSVKPVKSVDGGDFMLSRSVIFSRTVSKDASGKVVKVISDWAPEAEIPEVESPFIDGFTPDKAKIPALKVTKDSKPAEVKVYYTENPSHKKTYSYETKSLTRKVTYVRVNHDKSKQQFWGSTQTGTISRRVTTYGDGKVEYGDWSSYTFAEQDVTPMEGYVSDISVVPAQTCSVNDIPKDIVVSFRPVENVLGSLVGGSYTVKFTDGQGNTLKTQEVEEGESAVAPAAPKREGYSFAGWDKKYTDVSDNITVNAKWTKNKIESDYEYKTMKRYIYYYHADGSKVISVDGGHAIASQTVSTYRLVTRDTETGKVTYGSWEPRNFGEMEVMKYTGYTPSMSKIPEFKNATPDNPPKDIYIYYTNKTKPASNYTGYWHANGLWSYYKKGSVDKSHTGLKKAKDGVWYYFTNGVQDTSYKGLAKNKNGWFYLSGGKVDTSYTGMAKSPKNGKWYYVKKGRLDYSYNGMAKSPKNKKWYYMKGGVIDYSFKGIAKSPSNGKLFYMDKGMIDYSYSGTFKYNGNTYNVKNGVATLRK